MNDTKYYLYIDTKIKGALFQTINYYKNGIFGKDVTIIYKEYKAIKRAFQKELNKNHIKYISFKRYSELPDLKNKVIFYLFNAQSNCRLVSYREATHVFVTHGESNKVSSVKPIIKVYDFVVVAGTLGVDRYLENNIFNECDIKNKKIIKMGNTFIGDAKFKYNSKSKTILYAPTWEGGVGRENYSSITKDKNAFRLITKYIKMHNISRVVIQPHPNMGHRDKRYFYYFLKGIYCLKKSTDADIMIRTTVSTKRIKIILEFLNARIIPENETVEIEAAFTDVSAMEAQLINKRIPTYVFFSGAPVFTSSNKILSDHYRIYGIYDYKHDFSESHSLSKEFVDYVISYSDIKLQNIPANKRIDWLRGYIEKN